MNSAERLRTALGHREADRVPFVLPATLHGAALLGLSIRDYFSRGEHVAEGQLRLLARFGHDALSPTFYGALEMEAWGSPTLFRDDGPPNAGPPLVRGLDDVARLAAPDVQGSPRLGEALAAIRLLRSRVAEAVPILGTVISPFSAPVVQLGFGRYLELLHERRDLLPHLLAVNEQFCVSWANAQLAAGASVIGYVDPLASPTLLPRALYLETGWPVARRVVSMVRGPVAIHLASGPGLAVLGDLAAAGAVAVSASALEDLAAVKAACQGKLTVLGNLNAIAMRRWTAEETVAEVKSALSRGGPGGGFVLSDNHGEIPLQVPLETLDLIADTVRTWGSYPLEWAAKERGA